MPGDRSPSLPEQPFLAVQERRVEATWSGPLPPPAAMAEYDRIYPGAARTILEMAQAEQANRRATLAWSQGFAWGHYCDNSLTVNLCERKKGQPWLLPI